MIQLNQFLDLISAITGDIGLVDFIDILVISYAVYRILLFIEDTRAFNLLKGLGVIVVAYVLTKEFNLNTINTIIESLLPTSIIAIIVIFQPELRLGLEDLGKSRFLRDQKTSDAEVVEVCNEICKTIDICSKKRTGILIVIEQNIGLKDFVENGTTIHGKVTSELLNSIFWYGTPLHDGAVIIKNNLIEAAGCFLPTASNHKEIDKNLGSRHRAAVGLTEMTDAIVFIVSEETGSIRYARNGKINEPSNSDGIRKLIHTALAKVAKYRNEHGEETTNEK